MRVLLEMMEQQQIINVWSCTSTICKFIFYSSVLSGYFLVTERSDVQKIFARPLNSQNNKLSYQRVDMFEFDTIMCFIVLLIPLLPTPIFFSVFLAHLLREEIKKTKKKRWRTQQKYWKVKKNQIGTLFWNKVQSQIWSKILGSTLDPLGPPPRVHLGATPPP